MVRFTFFSVISLIGGMGGIWLSVLPIHAAEKTDCQISKINERASFIRFPNGKVVSVLGYNHGFSATNLQFLAHFINENFQVDDVLFDYLFELNKAALKHFEEDQQSITQILGDLKIEHIAVELTENELSEARSFLTEAQKALLDATKNRSFFSKAKKERLLKIAAGSVVQYWWLKNDPKLSGLGISGIEGEREKMDSYEISAKMNIAASYLNDRAESTGSIEEVIRFSEEATKYACEVYQKNPELEEFQKGLRNLNSFPTHLVNQSDGETDISIELDDWSKAFYGFMKNMFLRDIKLHENLIDLVKSQNILFPVGQCHRENLLRKLQQSCLQQRSLREAASLLPQITKTKLTSIQTPLVPGFKCHTFR